MQGRRRLEAAVFEHGAVCWLGSLFGRPQTNPWLIENATSIPLLGCWDDAWLRVDTDKMDPGITSGT